MGAARPSKAAQDFARRGLEARRRAVSSKKCCTPAGLARARAIIRGDNQDAVKIRNWFRRHEGSYKAAMKRAQGRDLDEVAPEEPAIQAWWIWGGDPMRDIVERATRERNPEADEESPYLYHVTYYGRLRHIADDGLRPGKARAIGGAMYDTHREGAIFLTEAGGVHFWGSKAEEWALNATDDIYGDELAPVLLRINLDYAIDFDAVCEEDEIGTRDAGGSEAWKCKVVVDPDDVEVWAGTAKRGEWVSVADWEEIPYDEAFEDADEEDDEYRDDERKVLKDAPWGSPSYLIPVEELLDAEFAETVEARENNPKHKLKNRLMR